MRGKPNPRMYNQVLALKRSGNYRLILLCKTFDHCNFSIFSKIFDDIICYQHLDLQKNGFYQNIDSSPKLHFIKYMVDSYIDHWMGNLSELTI